MEPGLLIIICIALLVAALVVAGTLKARPSSESARMRKARKIATSRINQRAAARDHYRSRGADAAIIAAAGDSDSTADSVADGGGAGGGD